MCSLGLLVAQNFPSSNTTSDINICIRRMSLLLSSTHSLSGSSFLFLPMELKNTSRQLPPTFSLFHQLLTHMSTYHIHSKNFHFSNLKLKSNLIYTLLASEHLFYVLAYLLGGSAPQPSQAQRFYIFLLQTPSSITKAQNYIQVNSESNTFYWEIFVAWVKLQSFAIWPRFLSSLCNLLPLVPCLQL